MFFRIPLPRFRAPASVPMLLSNYNSRDAVAVDIAFEHAHEPTLCARKSALSTGSSE